MPSYICGKCHSGSLYREDDRLNCYSFIACMICGNRYPGGKEPVKVGNNGKEHEIAAEKTLNREEPDMSTKQCVNCGRTMPITGKGMCSSCYSAQRKAGDDKALRNKILEEQRIKFSGLSVPSAEYIQKDPEMRNSLTVSQEVFPCIVLNFPGDDVKIYDALVKYAASSRRKIDQEILFRLESQLKGGGTCLS